jgi:hypothetical protein
MDTAARTDLPETTETLLDWKLTNSDVQFSEEDFLNGFEAHAEEANALFDAAFAEGL